MFQFDDVFLCEDIHVCPCLQLFCFLGDINTQWLTMDMFRHINKPEIYTLDTYIVTICRGAFAEIVDNVSIARLGVRLGWLKDLESLRDDVINAAKASPTIKQQLANSFLMPPTSRKALEELRKVSFKESP